MADGVHANLGLLTIESEARKALEAEGLSVDYAVLRRAEDLGASAPNNAAD
jgi:hypothetical protein